MVQKLNGCGIVPILATFGYMEKSIDHGIDPTNPCVVWEDDLVKQLDGLQWARFYEQWPDEFHMRSQWYPGSREGDRFAQVTSHNPHSILTSSSPHPHLILSQTIANGILEAKAGIPVVAHATPHNNSCQNKTNGKSFSPNPHNPHLILTRSSPRPHSILIILT